MALIGRTFLVLGGAFVIRALTDEGVVPGGLGVALGIAFGAVWIGFALLDARRQSMLSATFHGAAAAVIGFPLVLEAAARMHAMPEALAPWVLGCFTGLLLLVAAQAHLALLSWITLAFFLPTVTGLLRATSADGALTVVLLLVAGAALYVADSREWKGLRWPAALVADFVVMRGTGAANALVVVREEVIAALAFCAVLAALSLAALLHRTLWRRLPVRAFEAVQTVLGLAIATAGVLRLSGPLGLGTSFAGAIALLLSAGAFVLALVVVPRRQVRGADFVFYATLGVGLVFAGGALLVTGQTRALLWGVLALGAVILGRRGQQRALWTNAAALCWGAAAACGLAAFVQQHLAAPPGAWARPQAAALAVLGLAIASYAATALPSVAEAYRPASWSSRAPAGALLALGALGVAALLTLAGTLALPAAAPSVAGVAAVRTVALGTLAISLALLRRRVLRQELGWVAYLFLALMGLKLLAEDLWSGSAVTLLVAFAVYGALLILVPKLVRSAPVPILGEPLPGAAQPAPVKGGT